MDGPFEADARTSASVIEFKPRSKRVVVAASEAPPYRSAPGSIGREWLLGSDAFNAMVEDALRHEASSVLSDAFDTMNATHGEVTTSLMVKDAMTVAETAYEQFGGWTSLSVMGVLMDPGTPPDASDFAEEARRCGVFGPGEEIRFVPHWFNLCDFGTLDPVEIRSVLLDISKGRDPVAISPATLGDFDGENVFLLLGALSPSRDADGKAVVRNPVDTMARLMEFDEWSRSMSEKHLQVLLAMRPVLPSDLVDELAISFDSASGNPDGALPGGIEAMFAFVGGVMEREGSLPMSCTLSVEDQSLNVVLETEGGRELDRTTISVLDVPSAREFVRSLKGMVPSVAFAEPVPPQIWVERDKAARRSSFGVIDGGLA